MNTKKINLISKSFYVVIFALATFFWASSTAKADNCSNKYPANACVDTGFVVNSGQCVKGLCAGSSVVQCCPLSNVICNQGDAAHVCLTSQGNRGICNAAGQCAETGGGAVPTSNPQTGSGSGNTCATCFTNPLSFSSVEDFLTNGLLVALQRIIVSLSLVMIVYGAILYIISGGSSQMETGKKAIMAALTGLAIGIAAPSILKELSSVLGWGTTTNAAVNAAPSFTTIAINVLNFMLGIAGIIALIMIVIGAIMYLTSAGDDKRAEAGKKMFQYSLIGIIIAMSAMVLVTQIAKFFAA